MASIKRRPDGRWRARYRDPDGRERARHFTRKVDAQFIGDHLGDDLNAFTFLVAGPPPMAEAVQHALEEAGVRDENVIAERFSGY